jgi:hypothetical protein
MPFSKQTTWQRLPCNNSQISAEGQQIIKQEVVSCQHVAIFILMPLNLLQLDASLDRVLEYVSHDILEISSAVPCGAVVEVLWVRSPNCIDPSKPEGGLMLYGALRTMLKRSSSTIRILYSCPSDAGSTANAKYLPNLELWSSLLDAELVPCPSSHGSFPRPRSPPTGRFRPQPTVHTLVLSQGLSFEGVVLSRRLASNHKLNGSGRLESSQANHSLQLLHGSTVDILCVCSLTDILQWSHLLLPGEV